MSSKERKKIVGLSTGRKNGNSEILLKEACRGAEEYGIETEIIRAMELNVKPCVGCETCAISMGRGQEAKCIIKDDDVPWILEKTMVEDCGLIVSAPVYHLMPNSHFFVITHRSLPTMFNHPEVITKTRVGGIISVGGGQRDWTPFGISLITIFMLHTRKVVDQIQVNGAARPGHVVVNEDALNRARKLGKNVAQAMMMPIEEVTFMGDRPKTCCPVCYCDLLQVQEALPHVVCPICDVHGVLTGNGKAMEVEWDEKSVEQPRLSVYGIMKHQKYMAEELYKKYFEEQQEQVKEGRKEYVSYGKIIKP